MKVPYLQESTHVRYKWEVVCPTSVFGKRIRKHFNVKSQAEDYLRELNTQIRRHAAVPLTRDESLLLARWRSRLSLAEMEAALELAHERKLQVTVPLAHLCHEFVEHQVQKHKAGALGELHLRDCETRIPKIADSSIGQLGLSDITKADVQGWVNSLDGAPATRRNYLRHLQSVFNYAIAEGRLSASPAVGVYLPNNSKAAVGILKPADLEKLLEAASKDSCPTTFWWLVFGAFMGLRTSEIERLDWADVQPFSGDGELYVRPGKTETSERWVKFTDPLKAFDWLDKPEAGLVLGGFTERNRQPKRARVYAAAGVAVPQNGLRHSYASHHLVQFREPHQTAAEMGHTTPRQTYAAYRKAVSSTQAEAYWDLRFTRPF